MNTVNSTELRARFARNLSALYGTEVPAYRTLVDVSERVNADVLAEHGSTAERLGDLNRVTAERHGAIRLGTPEELRQVARVFGAVGMHPTGFYDLRDAKPSPIPVVSTAFRPIEPGELAANPFRVFTSLLTPEDRRFFDADLEGRLRNFLEARQLFPEELLALADRAEAEGGLSETLADRFLELATRSFALSDEPVDRDWYTTLERISAVAADIGGVTSTHINHLTPRVLDIDALYRRMEGHGIAMIDQIQGPPRWSGPDVLLRQTSFRALAEPRRFREPDGSVGTDSLRVRFGEVEARGVALTPAGRDLYDAMVAEADHRAESTGMTRQDAAAAVWEERLPGSEDRLAAGDLAFYTFAVARGRPRDGTEPPRDLAGLLDGGWITATPVVYEDFLPRSAAGIFSSNLTSEGSVDSAREAVARDTEWLSGVLDRPVRDPMRLYAAQRGGSLRGVSEELGLPDIRLAGDDPV
ncbi:VOC family protein [Streptomyces oceani]|uniref:2-oxoadipate dioxygenase/decarboxylase n=1 Tax=Streptomyces oceani TaxID=1075402 RepID=A0A1E7KGS5_9ACTN|nr:VOC family protein [Streptomyces oceani]OEV03152.1 hypothetical protein AN216_13195 [Streptomyces oceani]